MTTIPAWAVEAAASAPRISPADAGLLVAIFREARENPASNRPVPHVVYRFYDADDVLLYVGMTSNFKSRHDSHEERSPWYRFAVRHTVEPAESEEDARAAETTVIKAQWPIFNVSGAAEGYRERRAAYLASRDYRA